MNFFKNVWELFLAAPKSERFLMAVLMVFAVLDFVTGDIMMAIAETGVVIVAIFLSYRDLLWFNDNEDEVTFEMIAGLMADNPTVAQIIVQEAVDASHSVGDDAGWEEVADIAVGTMIGKIES